MEVSKEVHKVKEELNSGFQEKINSIQSQLAATKVEDQELRNVAMSVSQMPLPKGCEDPNFQEITYKDLCESIQAVLRTTECGICLEPVQLEMVQCVSGHVTCETCKDKMEMNNCPVCQQAFSDVKPRVLSQVLGLLPHQCKHKNCEKFLKFGDDHEKFCAWKETECQLDFDTELCDWRGIAEDLLKHVQNVHPYVTICSENNFKGIEDFDGKDVYYHLFSVHGKVFWSCIDLDSFGDVKALCIRIWFVPNGKPTGDLFYEITFSSPNAKFSLKIKLNQDPDVDTLEENIILIPKFMLPICTSEEDSTKLNFNITITKE